MMLERLKDLLNIQSYSGEEQQVVKYLKKELPLLGFKVKVDKKGNVYATRGEGPYVLMNAHMDSVKGYSKKYNYDGWYGGYGAYQTFTPTKRYAYFKVADEPTINGFPRVMSKEIQFKDAKQRSCVKCKDWINCFKYNDPITVDKIDEIDDMLEIIMEQPMKCYIGYEDGKSSKNDKKEEDVEEFKLFYDSNTTKLTSNGVRPMGGDDKAGIAIALYLAEKMPDKSFKFSFTVEEEIGCLGIKYALANHKDFFEDCLYSITCDRKGGKDICVTTGSEANASNYFVAELAKWGIITGVPVVLAAGSSSDNFYIKSVVPNAINISAGYYEPHSNSEYIMVNETIRTAKWVKNFIEKSDFRNKTTK